MTLTQLKQRVLEKLGVIATGEGPIIADANLIGARYTSLHEMLITEGLINWTPTEDVPTWAEEPIVLMTAAASMHEFGLPAARKAALRLDGQFNLPASMGGPSLAERQLRSQAAKNFIYYPQATEYF